MAEAAQVEVRGGETTVVELVATPSQSSDNLGAANKRGFADSGSGSLEVQMLDESGVPVALGPLYLLASNGKVLEMTIDSQGFGSLADVPVGDYELTLQKPAANPTKDERLLGQLKFASSQITLPKDGLVEIRKILDMIKSKYSEGNKGIYRLTAHGYADNVPDTTTRTDYAFARAQAVKQAIETEREKQQMPWLEVAMQSHGVQPGDTEPERAQNRRVDIILRPPQPT